MGSIPILAIISFIPFLLLFYFIFFLVASFTYLISVSSILMNNGDYPARIARTSILDLTYIHSNSD